jgi:hypothetical protein
MPEKDELFTTKVKHTGIFNFKELYRILFEWLIDKGYDVNEKTYKEVVGGSGAKEIEIEWDAERKVTDYFKFNLKVEWHIIGMTSVEVEIDGSKEKMNKGQLEIKFKSVLLKDYRESWTSNPFIKFLRTFYDKYLIKERLEQYEGKLIGDMEEMIAECKSFLALTGKR